MTAVPPGRPILVDPTEAMPRSDLRLHLCFRYELRELSKITITSSMHDDGGSFEQQMDDMEAILG